MNNEQARPTSQPTPSVASGKEDYRKYIARKRRQRRKQRRLILCAAAMLVLVLLIISPSKFFCSPANIEYLAAKPQPPAHGAGRKPSEVYLTNPAVLEDGAGEGRS